MLLLVVTLAVLSSSCRTRVVLPGELVLSEADWNYVLYFNGITTRRVQLKEPVAGVRAGPGGRLFAVSRFIRDDSRTVVSNSIVELLPDGSTVPLFAIPQRVLSFSTTLTSLVVLASRADNSCPTLLWVHYDGRVHKTLSAPCSTRDPEAASEDEVILTEIGSDPEMSASLLMLRGNQFTRLGQGSRAAWISTTQYMFQDVKGCIRKGTLGVNASSIVLCQVVFEQAASTDGRYVAVHVPVGNGPLGIKEIKELRVVDTRNGNYVSVSKGPVPDISWRLDQPSTR